MLAFQNTVLYKKTLTVLSDILKNLQGKESSAFEQKIEEETLNITQNLAKALSKENEGERNEILNKAKDNIYGLLSFVELAKTKSSNNEETYEKIIQQLVDLHNEFNSFSKKQKRILIFSSPYGQGHITAANAIKQAIEQLYGQDFHVEIIDFDRTLNAALSKTVLKLYEGSTKFTPSIYEIFFTKTDKKWQVKLLNYLNYPFCMRKMATFFKEKKPDLVISTWPNWDYIAVHFLKKYDPTCKFISIVTDSISIHNIWVTAEADYHIVPNIDTAFSLRKLGVEETKIKPLGFPMKLSYMDKTDRESFLKKNGLNPKLFTILFLPTAQSETKNKKILKDLLEHQTDQNIIVICGRDERVKTMFKKFTPPKNFKIIGWTDQMPDFIKSSDVVITKAGGATVMECLAAAKPMVITTIIGQEIGNAELIKRYGLGIVATEKTANVSESVAHIRKHQKTFQKSLQQMSNPEAAIKIASFLKEIMEKK